MAANSPLTRRNPFLLNLDGFETTLADTAQWKWHCVTSKGLLSFCLVHWNIISQNSETPCKNSLMATFQGCPSQAPAIGSLGLEPGDSNEVTEMVWLLDDLEASLMHLDAPHILLSWNVLLSIVPIVGRHSLERSRCCWDHLDWIFDWT